MIVNLDSFIQTERPYWEELEALLDNLERDAAHVPGLAEVRRFYYLYRRAASGLARLRGMALENETPEYLEGLVARAYAEIHEVRRAPYRFHPVSWFFHTFPNTFRRHLGAFYLALGLTLLGAALGSIALIIDPGAKEVLMPFAPLLIDPGERVAHEEQGAIEAEQVPHAIFASQLMTNNIRVSINALALGITFGLGTIIILFYNGAIIGAVLLDYIRAGESVFLAGWLLPHGSIEIPAILLAGQAGLVLGHAVIGWGTRVQLQDRLRLIAPDLVTLIGGVSLMLIWAGLVESFFSQYHAPVFPYSLKILFGLVELILLVVFLGYSGRKALPAEDAAPDDRRLAGGRHA